MAKILKDLQVAKEKEAKPTPVVQPTGSRPPIYEVEHNSMNNYHKSDWNDCKLTMKSTWIQYLEWKRRLDNHFKHVERLSTLQFDRRVIRLHDAMDVQWIHHIEREIMANNVRDWEQMEACIKK